MIVLLALACALEGTTAYHFDAPIAAASLPISEGPFDVEVGVVANQRSGVLTALNLKEGRILTTGDVASFLRGPGLTTGQARLLTDVAIHGTGDTVTVWTADEAFGQLLQVPWVLSVDADGQPVLPTPTMTDPVFVGGSGSSTQPALSALKVRSGWTTTEDWVIEYDGARWWATGTRSGEQIGEPHPGVLYHTDFGELEFQVDGDATAGDRFEIHTETGVIEHAAAGRIGGLLERDGIVYVSVAAAGAPVIEAWDAVSGTLLASYPLDADAQPGHMVAGPPGVLYVADTLLSVVHVLTLAGDGLSAVDTPLGTDGSLQDVAWVASEGQDGEPYEHLFVAPVGKNRVDIYDTLNGVWLDPNPLSLGAWGVQLTGPVNGLAASKAPVDLQQDDAWGARQRSSVISITTGDGYMYALDAETGCLVVDAHGPHGPNPSYDGTEYPSLEDLGSESDVHIQYDATTGEAIQTSLCGGVTRTESWIVTFHSATLDWSVEGTLSGPQAHRAVLDQRYLSDDGAISFVLLGGALPPSDGDTFVFSTDSGLLALAGSDVNEDGSVDAKLAWESPSRPLTFETENGPTGGGWDPADIRQYALIPAQGSDVVGNVWLDEGQTSIVYQ